MAGSSPKGPLARPTPPPPFLLAARAMRTRFEIVITDDRDPVSVRAAAEAALDEIARVEGELSPFRSDSALAEINAAAAARPVRVDGAMFALLARAARLTERLEGAFDLTVGAPMDALRAGASDEALARAHALVGFGDVVRLDPGARTVAFTRPGVRLDPGAIGKGYALERAADVLRDAGIARALIHGGTSSVYALGAPRGAPGWSVAVQDPLDPERRIARATLRDRALGVSAIGGRTFQRGGARHGHVLDPRTGLAVTETLLAAVVAALPGDADAMSTALLVLGRAALRRLPRRFPGAAFLVAGLGRANRLRVDTAGAAARPGARLTVLRRSGTRPR